MLTNSFSQTNLPRTVRYLVASLAAIIAFIYFLIGFHVVSVLDGNADQTFGIFAGLAYALGVILLLVMHRRVVWILGALFQIFVIFTYFNLASQRTPAFEFWGILLRVFQLIILFALAYLAFRLPTTHARASGNRR